MLESELLGFVLRRYLVFILSSVYYYLYAFLSNYDSFLELQVSVFIQCFNIEIQMAVANLRIRF